jgi:hypothetical protein
MTTPSGPDDTNDADDPEEVVPLAVWRSAQVTAQRQRTGVYLPECRQHPG